MGEFILGAAVLAAMVWLLRDKPGRPTLLGRGLRRIGGIALLSFGVMALIRGQLPLGMPVALMGAVLAGWIQLPRVTFGRSRRQRPGASAQRVSTAYLDLEVHPVTGAMRGMVRVGRLAGRTLISLGAVELQALHREVSGDPRSRSVLEAYLDRRSPGWREHFQEDPAAGRARRSGHAMAEEEAYQILGVQPGAGADEIRRAHKTLMKKVHPDQGGTTALAARVNEAKDVLLGNHPPYS